MKNLLKKSVLFLAVSFLFACSKDDTVATPVAQNPVTTNIFTATIGAENFSTNEVTLITISAGGTQGFFMNPVNGKSFSSAIFAENFPIGQAISIAFSSALSYRVGDITYIPKSGTMTLSIMEPYNRMKGVFSGVFVSSGASDITISGEFDVSK